MSSPHHPWLAIARDLDELIRGEAAAVEAAGTLTPVVLDALANSGLLPLMLPRQFGGQEVDLVTMLELIEQISRSDGSVGWNFMVYTTGAAAACAYLPAEGLAAIYGGDRPPMLAGMLSPGGSAVPTGDGFTVSGKYRFGSGALNAEWIGAGVFVREDGQVRSRQSGGADIRTFYFRRDQANLLGNWDVLGMKGTGSVDYEIIDQYVGPEFGFELPEPVSTSPLPSYQLGLGPSGAAGHGAIAAGVAARALEEIAKLAVVKRRQGMAGIGDQQLFQFEFAEQDAALRAARLLMFDSYRDALGGLERGCPVTPLQRDRMRQSVTYLTRVADDVVRWCYRWSGSHGLRNPSALGRCLRDMATATQHIFVDVNTMANAAPQLMSYWATTEESEHG